MKSIKGPAIFLAQFMGDEPPYDSLENLCQWVSNLGFKGIQIPTSDPHYFDLKRAAQDLDYCNAIKDKVASYGLEITELSTHLQGQLVAVHPAYDSLFDAFAPEEVHNNPEARTTWAIQQLKYAATASKNLGLTAHVTFSGALAWPYLYPWPQRPPGLIETAFEELAQRWQAFLDHFDKEGID
ncbi:MAG: sugar phosphate isomerase/epimerase, partial [Saprospiraceae bacterium]|nr:sugar phosphate isomerase/epimerase [Saprospiraceae bacterium]